MKAVLQRVTEARVDIEEKTIGSITQGLLVLLGVEAGDTEAEADYIIRKTMELRIFNDDDMKMNRSLLDIQGELLLVSQFTLLGDCRKGRRPSFNHAASPEDGRRLYEYCIEAAKNFGIKVECGKFGAMMKVSLLNDGPVTIMLDSRRASGHRIPIVS